ncbi:MAG TPA: NBR1-Ig-like domain-containing protein [Anaerolineales bacterium]|nr:NBR1-Ig-like domain-containing protein [Anaerolineales bacterium]
MTATRKTKLLVWVIALALVMACVPTLTAPSVPTVDPGAVNMFIAQTVNAASTQTAAAMPSSTPSPTLTPTVNTETPSPTATSTVIFVLSTPTPLVIPTFTNVSSGGGGSSSENFSCQVTRVAPANGSSFDPRDDFDAVWTVRNNGQRNWDRNSIDHIYTSGDKIHKISGYDLDSNVRVGNSIDLGVDMQAPKDPGTYTTTWNLRSGSRNFCTMTLTIVVR